MRMAESPWMSRTLCYNGCQQGWIIKFYYLSDNMFFVQYKTENKGAASLKSLLSKRQMQKREDTVGNW